MPLTRQEKERLLEGYARDLEAVPHVFVLDYRGITVPEVTELRNRVREVGGRYQVVKNSLVLRAIAGKPLEALREHFQGPTAVAFSTEAAVPLAKALTEFAKDVPAIEFKGGLVDGQPVDAAAIREIAELPSREVLLARLVFVLQSPMARLARVLAAVPQQFASVLDQIRNQKESHGQ